MRTRPADAADENETAGQEGYSETFHTFTSMNKELERYIEREIIPRYEDFDAAHRTDHVRTVIAQSLELAAHYDADADMVYTVAAYHDTGLANGRERHHIDAGRILAADTELRRWFSEEQIAVMRDAVEDHRASSDGEPCGYLSVQQEAEELFHLQKIYVLPRFQGLGVGEFLFRHAVEYVRSVHPAPCRMELNVNRSNRAVRFYEKMGMRKLREGDFPIGDGYYMNDYIMGLEIE